MSAVGFRDGLLMTFDEVTSTMDVAKSADAVGTPLTVVARSQTQGRGRYERTWVSAPNGGLYLTVRIPWKNRPMAQAANVSQGAALALGLLSEELGCPHVVLKWPNDLLLSGAKAAGILAEMSPTPDGNALLVGVGINVCQPQNELAHVGQPAISLSNACGQNLSINSILSRFLQLWSAQDLLLETHGFAGIAEEYRRFTDLAGRHFRLAQGNRDELIEIVRIRDDGGMDAKSLSDGREFQVFGGELIKP
jgi:BirA family biotin operon repressor/biotin-[acetyl-CoA-carboxylase] ligase